MSRPSKRPSPSSFVAILVVSSALAACGKSTTECDRSDAACEADAMTGSDATHEEDAAPGETCGGFVGASCPGAAYCDYPPEAACGSGDQLGTCRLPPSACTDEVDPVCGCDGETYTNACEARAASTSIFHEGACD